MRNTATIMSAVPFQHTERHPAPSKTTDDHVVPPQEESIPQFTFYNPQRAEWTYHENSTTSFKVRRSPSLSSSSSSSSCEFGGYSLLNPDEEGRSRSCTHEDTPRSFTSFASPQARGSNRRAQSSPLQIVESRNANLHAKVLSRLRFLSFAEHKPLARALSWPPPSRVLISTKKPVSREYLE